ncbi:MAG TPA: hypothetical protein VNN06_16225 [Ramlibacter sp.]|nr:hypothetical protein [Ramlibacter sp.]
MPNRFSTEAANADAMGEDPAASEGMTDAIGADGTPRDRSDRSSQAERKGGTAKSGESKASGSGDEEGKPDKEASVVKDKDAAKP